MGRPWVRARVVPAPRPPLELVARPATRAAARLCITGGGASGGESIAGSIGGCAGAPAGGASGTTPVDDGSGAGAGGGSDVAGSSASGPSFTGALASVAGKSLPFTGLAVWMLALAGILALAAGGVLRRRYGASV